MAQVTDGIRKILSHPVVYEAFQNIMGARRGRAMLVRDYIRPFSGMRILDLGCGTAEILSFLPSDITYVGYDMSPEYIAAARAKFSARGTFHCRLLEETEVATLEKFDLVMGLGVLHHLDDGSAEQFMRLANAALKSDGRVLTRDPVYARGQNLIARFLVSRDRGQNVRDADGYAAIARRVFGSVKGSLTHQRWIPYTHYTMECGG